MGKTVRALLVLGIALLPVSGLAQDSAEVRKRLAASLEEKNSTGYYSEVQLRELAELASGKLAGVSDAATRERLLRNVLDYASVNKASKAILRVNPVPDGENPVEVLRPASAWALYKYELDKRLSSAVAAPKSRESIDQSLAQLDRLARTADLRLAAMLEGPGAETYRKEWLVKFRGALSYYAESSLELPYPRPLSDAELKELEHRIATFSRPAGGATLVRIDDPAKPPFEAAQLTDFGILSAAQVYLHSMIQDPDATDPKYMEMARQMKQELDLLQESINSDKPIELPGREVPSKKGPVMQRQDAPASDSTTIPTPPNPRSGDAARSAEQRRRPAAWMIGLVVLGVLAACLWSRRKRAPSRPGN